MNWCLNHNQESDECSCKWDLCYVVSAKKYYVTFPQSHPLKDNWLEVIAPNQEKAREIVFRTLGDKWAFLYTAKLFKKGYFPLGAVGSPIIADFGGEE